MLSLIIKSPFIIKWRNMVFKSDLNILSRPTFKNLAKNIWMINKSTNIYKWEHRFITACFEQLISVINWKKIWPALFLKIFRFIYNVSIQFVNYGKFWIWPWKQNTLILNYFTWGFVLKHLCTADFFPTVAFLASKNDKKELFT